MNNQRNNNNDNDADSVSSNSSFGDYLEAADCPDMTDEDDDRLEEEEEEEIYEPVLTQQQRRVSGWIAFLHDTFGRGRIMRDRRRHWRRAEALIAQEQRDIELADARFEQQQQEVNEQQEHEDNNNVNGNENNKE